MARRDLAALRPSGSPNLLHLEPSALVLHDQESFALLERSEELPIQTIDRAFAERAVADGEAVGTHR